MEIDKFVLSNAIFCNDLRKTQVHKQWDNELKDKVNESVQCVLHNNVTLKMTGCGEKIMPTKDLNILCN